MDLISTRQTATRLGVTARRVRALHKLRDDFPAPVELDGRLYWHAAEVDAWAAGADRAPGAPVGNRNNPHGRRGRPAND